MAGIPAKNATHVDLWVCPPESLTVETNKTSPFYDERIENPVDEALVQSIMMRGVLKPVLVIRDGDRFVVDDGRQRVRACTEANKRLRKAGKPEHKVGYIVKRVGSAEAGIIGLSAAGNIHVTNTPIQRARKALRMEEAGATRDEIAVDFGVTRQCVDNWLTLLDCAAPIQKAVDEGRVGESVARKLAGLDREKQREVFDEMVAKGATKGAAAGRAVTAGKRGRAVPEGQARKMRSRAQIEAVFAGLKDCNGELKPDGRAVRDFIRWMFRECEAGELCDDVAQILVKPDAKDEVAS